MKTTIKSELINLHILYSIIKKSCNNKNILKEVHDVYGIDFNNKNAFNVFKCTGYFTPKQFQEKFNIGNNIKAIGLFPSRSSYQTVSFYTVQYMEDTFKLPEVLHTFYTKQCYNEYRQSLKGIDSETEYFVITYDKTLNTLYTQTDMNRECDLETRFYWTDKTIRIKYTEPTDKYKKYVLTKTLYNVLYNGHMYNLRNRYSCTVQGDFRHDLYRDINNVIDKSGYSIQAYRKDLRFKLEKYKESKALMNKQLYLDKHDEIYNLLFSNKQDIIDQLTKAETQQDLVNCSNQLCTLIEQLKSVTDSKTFVQNIGTNNYNRYKTNSDVEVAIRHIKELM